MSQITLNIVLTISLLCFCNSSIANTSYIPKEYQTPPNHLTPQQKDLLFSKNFLIIVDSKTQTLHLYDSNRILLKSYKVSTSKRGLGQLIGSLKTPTGLHIITEKIGNNVPNYGIFRKRKFTKAVWKKNNSHCKKGFIVTRILRLKGLEPGVNCGKNDRGQIIDSFHRGIYIHGTTMEWKLGTPATIGCVHLSSKDIVELFDLVPVGSLVMIY